MLLHAPALFIYTHTHARERSAQRPMEREVSPEKCPRGVCPAIFTCHHANVRLSLSTESWFTVCSGRRSHAPSMPNCAAERRVRMCLESQGSSMNGLDLLRSPPSASQIDAKRLRKSRSFLSSCEGKWEDAQVIFLWGCVTLALEKNNGLILSRRAIFWRPLCQKFA